MKSAFYLLYFVLLLFIVSSCTKSSATTSENLLAEGRQPQIAVAPNGVTHVVYGLEDNIYYTSSTDNGITFSRPKLVGKIPDLLLGMAMGPQIASSAKYSVVTAIDKKGNIHSFTMKNGTDKWVKSTGVNDVPGVAAEGLMAVACDADDNFYAVWLDVRNNKQNKIVLASKTGSGNWSLNRIVYESPDSTVCECCKPGIAVNGKQVTLMFRNWIYGARDFYYVRSTNKGQHFTKAEKLGEGTWKLQGCPMDGGGIVTDKKGRIHTAWQRDGKIFYAQPGKPEVQIGKGRNCRIIVGSEVAIAWQDNKTLKVKYLGSGKEIVVGKGSYIETATLPDNKTVWVWENDKKIYFRKL